MMNSLDNGLLRPFKPYPAYRPSGVDWLGDIPAHWEVKRLRVTVQRCQNGVWGAEPSGDNDIACVRVADFDRIKLRANMDKPTFRSIEPSDIQTHSLYPGDLLLEGSGGGEKHPVGAVVLYDSEKPAVCSNFIAQLRPSDGFESRFLTYLHFTLYSARVNVRSIKQSIGIQNLDKASYLNEAAALPPLPEQHAISAFLDRETARIDSMVSREERLIELLQEKRTALITRAVTRGLEPNAPMKDSDVEWLGEIPAHWEVKRLKYSAPLRNGKLDNKPEDATYVGLENIEPWTGKLLLDYQPDSVDSTVVTFAPGDVLFGKLRPYLAKVARPSFEGTATSEILVFQPMDECSQSYLAYCLLNAPYIRWIDTLAYGARMPRVSPDEVACSFIPLPPLPEQHAIATFLDRESAKLDALIAKVREAIDRLRELRTALISTAVTGRIDVREEAT